MRCEICKKECSELFDYSAYGLDDFYTFETCEECFNHYSSDIFTAEDIHSIMDMNITTIFIKVKNRLRVLTNENNGRIMYNTQIKDIIDWDKFTVIKFPIYIEDASLAFLIGFQEEIFKNIKKDEFNKYFEIQGNERLLNKFIKTIYI